MIQLPFISRVRSPVKQPDSGAQLGAGIAQRPVFGVGWRVGITLVSLWYHFGITLVSLLLLFATTHKYRMLKHHSVMMY
jgi:hypothetical protein